MKYYLSVNRKSSKGDNSDISTLSPYTLNPVDSYLWSFESDDDFFNVARSIRDKFNHRFYYLVIPECDSEDDFLCHSNHGYMNFGLDRLKDEQQWNLDLILNSSSEVLKRLEDQIQKRLDKSHHEGN